MYKSRENIICAPADTNKRSPTVNRKTRLVSGPSLIGCLALNGTKATADIKNAIGGYRSMGGAKQVTA